ncbi:MAG: hypothetical protein LBT59_18500 [Clostridiales bacterium]|jgi:hypothetical protein|nr:hypothetical protein [Clostridiales bacterium]
MKNKAVLWGLLGFAGILGWILGSTQLMAFALFFPMLLLFSVEKGRMSQICAKASRNAFVFFVFAFFTCFFFASILMKLFPGFMADISFDMLAMLLIGALSIAFAGTIAVFSASLLLLAFSLPFLRKKA